MAKQSEDILKLFAKNDGLTNDMVEMIWDASQIGDAAKLQIYEMIKNNADYFSDDILTYFLNNVSNIYPNMITNEDIVLVSKIGNNASYKSHVRRAATQVLFQIAIIQKPGYKSEHVKSARKNLDELVRHFNTDEKLELIQQCVERIKDETTTSAHILKVFLKLFNQLPKYA